MCIAYNTKFTKETIQPETAIIWIHMLKQKQNEINKLKINHKRREDWIHLKEIICQTDGKKLDE